MAAGAIAIPLVLLIALMLGGGKKEDVTAAYQAGFAKGKADKENGMVESLNPAAGTTYTGANATAYAKGYTAGYAAGVKKTGGGPVVDTSKQTNGKDTETVAQAQSRGYAQGLADGRQDGSASNGYGYTHTKPTYTRGDLKAAYESQWTSGYSKGYAEGVKHKEDGGGIIMGDVLGTKGGNARDFKPMTDHASYRRNGYPRNWYNY